MNSLLIICKDGWQLVLLWTCLHRTWKSQLMLWCHFFVCEVPNNPMALEVLFKQTSFDSYNCECIIYMDSLFVTCKLRLLVWFVLIRSTSLIHLQLFIGWFLNNRLYVTKLNIAYNIDNLLFFIFKVASFRYEYLVSFWNIDKHLTWYRPVNID